MAEAPCRIGVPFYYPRLDSVDAQDTGDQHSGTAGYA